MVLPELVNNSNAAALGLPPEVVNTGCLFSCTQPGR